MTGKNDMKLRVAKENVAAGDRVEVANEIKDPSHVEAKSYSRGRTTQGTNLAGSVFSVSNDHIWYTHIS